MTATVDYYEPYSLTTVTATITVGESSPMPTGKECPKGHYCQNGEKNACAINTYQAKFGQIQCDSCPAGYQCPTDGSGFYSVLEICGPNHYCSSGTALKVACTATGTGDYYSTYT